MIIETPFGSSGNKYKFLGDATIINGYPEVRETGGRARYVILPDPGMVSFCSVTDTPCRGAVYLEDLDSIRAVHSGSVYSVSSSGTATRLGTIPGIDNVVICRNKKATPQTIIRTAVGVYVEENGAVRKMIGNEFGAGDNVNDIDNCTWVENQGGYTIFLFETGMFGISSQNEATETDPLDFGTAEQTPDKAVAIKAIGDGIIIFKQYNAEFWRNTGAADFPYEPIPGAVIKKGLLAAHSLREFDNSLVWVGVTREGDRAVYRLNGYQPVKISTPEVDRAIAAEASPENIEGMAYSFDGHAFYTITGEGFSFTYDAASQVWHPKNSNSLDYWRAKVAISAWNKVIVGDRLTGSLYSLSTSTYTEAGDTLIWKIRTPTMHAFPNGGVIDALSIGFLAGQGVMSPTAQGYEPKLMVRKSVDGGNTFGPERLIDTGKQGKYRTRIKTRRLGRFDEKGCVFEFSMSDPVGRGLDLIDAQVRPLRR